MNNIIAAALKNPSQRNCNKLFGYLEGMIPEDTLLTFMENVRTSTNVRKTIECFITQWDRVKDVYYCFKECSRITSKHMVC